MYLSFSGELLGTGTGTGTGTGFAFVCGALLPG